MYIKCIPSIYIELDCEDPVGGGSDGASESVDHEEQFETQQGIFQNKLMRLIVVDNSRIVPQY